MMKTKFERLPVVTLVERFVRSRIKVDMTLCVDLAPSLGAVMIQAGSAIVFQARRSDPVSMMSLSMGGESRMSIGLCVELLLLDRLNR